MEVKTVNPQSELKRRENNLVKVAEKMGVCNGYTKGISVIGWNNVAVKENS